jgi:hypothetical protein
VGERVDQQLEDERDVEAAAGLAHRAHEALLVLVDLAAGVGAVVGQHLHPVAAHALDLGHRPALDRVRLAALGRLLEAVVLQRQDQALARRQVFA